MTFDRSLWKKTFGKYKELPCPSCDHGRVRIDLKTLHHEETKASRRNADENGVTDPIDRLDVFSCLMKCSNRACQEVISASGTLSYDPYIEQDGGGTDFEEVLKPHSIYPAPRIIHIPKDAPKECAS